MVGDGRERLLGLAVVVEKNEDAFREFFLIRDGDGDRIGGLVVEVVVVVVVDVVDGLEDEEVWTPRPGKGSCFHLVVGRVMGFDSGAGTGAGGGGGSGLCFSGASPIVWGGGDSPIIAASGLLYVCTSDSLRSTEYVQRERERERVDEWA